MSAPATRIHDLTGVEVEHLLGAKHGPLVKLRAISGPAILLGEFTPAAARQIARDLTTCAARAEYEHDLFVGLEHHGMEREAIAFILHAVREGEQAHEGEGR